MFFVPILRVLRAPALACGASALLVLSAPFVGQIRRQIQLAFPGKFAFIIGAVVAALIGSAIVLAVARVRDRRAGRYGALASALVLAGAYAALTRTGRADVDAVEHFHFVEYGLVTWLFYRAGRSRDDVSVFVLPVLAALIVGTADEWFQWLIPARIGELRDIFLNGAAIACGLIFSAAMNPPSRLTPRLNRASLERIGVLAAAAIVALALFIHIVHIGHEIHDPEVGSFRSRYARGELLALEQRRSVEWRGRTLPVPARLSIEDQYFSEGITHVRRRNQRWEEDNALAAWRENLILEKYFAPVLDTPSYLSAAGHRWPPDQRADAQLRSGGGAPPYVSDAQEYPIYTWSKPVFWMIVGALAAAILVATRGK